MHGIRQIFLTAFVLLAAASFSSAGCAKDVDSSVLRATLHNGLRVIIIRNPLAPVVTTQVNYLVGSNEAPPGFPGMAHAQEHMMFRGSPGLTANQLTNISAAMGGSFDAATQQTLTRYYFTVPAKDLDVALHIQALRMSGVLDSKKEWDQERGAIEQEVAQDLSNPQYVLYTKLLGILFKGTPYAVDALGTRPSFEKTTAKMLKQFYGTWYVPNNAILVIAGEVQPQQTLATVKKLFGKIPAKKLPPRPQGKLHPLHAQTLRSTTDLPYGMSAITFRTPGYDSPDYAAAVVLADVLSSERGTLYELVPKGKALFTDFDMHPFPTTGMAIAAAGFPTGADPDALLKEVKAILAKTLKDGVPADLVEAAKRRELAGVEFRKNSVSGLASVWSNALALMGRHSPDDDIRALKKVTVADVNRVARQYLDLDTAVTAVLTPQPSGKPTTHSSFGGSESFTPSKTTEVKLPAWAEAAVKRLSIPDSTVHPVVSTLPNGIKLIVQPETVSDTVSVYGSIKNNPFLQTPKDKEGASSILEQLFDYGSQSLDRLAFQKALDDIAADESAGTDFSVSVLTQNFDRGVQLLADNELHPALPEAAFKVTRTQTAAAIEGQLHSPGFLVNQALHAGLYTKNDPTLRHATPESIKALSLDDVKAYYRDVFRPDMTTIVVIGNVTPQGARKVIERYFGKWQAHGPKPETLFEPASPNKPSVTHIPNPARVQDSVTLAETVDLTFSNPDYYTLALGNHVLSGAFYATRLYRDLRERAGLVYYVSSAFNIGERRSTFAVSYACDPPNVSKARAMIQRDLKEMQEQPVSQEELVRAKALLLRTIPLSESSLGSIAGALLRRSLNDLPLDEPIRAAKVYVHLTAKDVQKAFAKWIRPKDLVQVSQGPTPQ